MADSVQIHPKISQEVFDRLEKVKDEQGQTRGDLVETALRDYLWPKSDPEKIDLLMQQFVKLQENIDVEFATVQQILGKLVGVVEGLTHAHDTPLPVAEPAPEPLRIAPYEEIYADDPLFNPALRKPPEPTPNLLPPKRRSWWHRLIFSS